MYYDCLSSSLWGHNFGMKPFFYLTNFSGQKCWYFKNKKSKKWIFFIIFKGLSVATCLRLKSGSLTFSGEKFSLMDWLKIPGRCIRSFVTLQFSKVHFGSLIFSDIRFSSNNCFLLQFSGFWKICGQSHC